MRSYYDSDGQPISWLIFYLSAGAAIGLFFIPALIIRPFRHQTHQALALAIALRDRAPWGTLVAALLCLVCAFLLWQFDNLRRKVVLLLVLLLVGFSTLMSRLNYFEWMFHPIDSAQFESEAASKVDEGQMILAVRFGSDARAYPVSQMAYHHVLNDVVEGIPVAVTY
jgi:hypothetical protein